MSEMDDLYAMIGASAANGKGDNFRDGKGIVVVREVLNKKLNDGHTFIVATKVISSESKGDTDPFNHQPVAPNAVGSTPSWPQKLTKFKSAPGNVKGFVLTLLGYAEANVTGPQFSEALGKMLSKEQPARGMLIGYETYQQAVRSGPQVGTPAGMRTYVKWVTVPKEAGNTPAEIAARRAELDKTDPIRA